MSIVLCEGKPGEGMSYVPSYRWIVRVYGGKHTQKNYLRRIDQVREAVAYYVEHGIRFEVERVTVGVVARVAS